MTGRLGSLLARALDWCADGVALVEVDCTVSHANRAFASIARARDGIGTRKGVVEIADLQMRARLAAALGAMLREHEPAGGSEPIDFQLPGPSGAPAYIISIRPLLGAMPHDAKRPVAVLFVRDRDVRGAGDARMLRDLFGLTTAEANLALALQRGVSPNDYARAHRISINTVYTRLRRIKEKTACQRLPELICRLAELRGLPVTG